MIKIIPATTQDAKALAPIICEKDVAEISCSSGRTPLESLLSGVKHSAKAYSLYSDNNILGMFGVVAGINDFGWIWMLAADIKRERIAVAKRYKYWVDYLAKSFLEIGSYVHTEQTQHIKLLLRFGFNPDGLIYIGLNDSTFVKLTRRGADV